MDYASAVTATWRHYELDEPSGREEALVRYATLAASSHNTQPWLFELQPGRISVHPDLTRRCPEVDPDDHHLYASLGCAVENLLLAARAAGLEGRASCDAGASRVLVEFERASAVHSPLFYAIPRRQCSRTEYDGTLLSTGQRRLLERAGNRGDVTVKLLTDKRQKEQLAEYVAAGNQAQFEDPRWAAEMRKWLRFNRRTAVRSGDGLLGAALGIPEIPQWLGKGMMPFAASAARQSQKDVRQILSSAAIAVIYSERDDRPHWVEAGRSFERLALQATALDLRVAFINQPVEVPTIRHQLAAYLGIGQRRPDLILRLGRGPEGPRSLRRPLRDVLLGEQEQVADLLTAPARNTLSRPRQRVEGVPGRPVRSSA